MGASAPIKIIKKNILIGEKPSKFPFCVPVAAGTMSVFMGNGFLLCSFYAGISHAWYPVG
jgi:hypothetical protein